MTRCTIFWTPCIFFLDASVLANGMSMGFHWRSAWCTLFGSHLWDPRHKYVWCAHTSSVDRDCFGLTGLYRLISNLCWHFVITNITCKKVTWVCAQQRVFAVRMKKAWVLSYPLSAQRKLWSDWADSQADLSLRWAHTFCWFCHVVTQMEISITGMLPSHSDTKTLMVAWM